MRPVKEGARVNRSRLEHRRFYAEYIKSPKWYARRRRWFTEIGNETVYCAGGCGKQVTEKDDFHHRTYDRLGNEGHDDLVVLCRACHDTLHYYIDCSRQWRMTERSVATDTILARMRRARAHKEHRP